MRLDEWQKFIASQFLDEEESPPVKPEQEIGSKPPDPQRSAPVHTPSEQRADTQGGRPSDERGTLGSARQAEPATAHGEATPHLPVGTARETTAAVKLPVAPPAAADADVPNFMKYLRGARGGADAPARQIETTPTTSRQRPGESLFEVPTASEPRSGGEGGAPEEGKAADARRAPRTRAPHARNVRPEHVPSGLSASPLWVNVPAHVRSLLALERLEENQEVAQYSYKRPFTESRQELIARLIDPILTLEETARLLNVCPTTVRRYTNKGILTHYRKEPDRPKPSGAESDKETRQRRFRLSDILAFLETQYMAVEADRELERRRAREALTREQEGHYSDREKCEPTAPNLAGEDRIPQP